MPKTICMEQVYRECKQMGVKFVAKRLGISYQRLVADLYQAGVVGESGCPSQREIAERCQEMRKRWSERVQQSRWEAARGFAAG